MRNEFVYREGSDGAYDQGTGGAAIGRLSRPPATAIMSGQGAALRLMLMMLAQAQLPAVHAAPAGLKGNGAFAGWSDWVVVPQHPHGHTDTTLQKLRAIRRCLGKPLADNHLVRVPSKKTQGTLRPRQRDYDHFELLKETGTPGASKYRPPTEDEETFILPGDFINKGWVHVLEDAELAVLMMVACGQGALTNAVTDLEPGEVAIPTAVRTKHYGLGKDSYSTGYPALEKLGLITVRPIDRQPDRRATSRDVPRPHRMKLRLEGFEADAVEAVKDAGLG